VRRRGRETWREKGRGQRGRGGSEGRGGGGEGRGGGKIRSTTI